MNYYHKPIDKVGNDVKLKIRLGALTLKISENNDKIDSLLEVDENIKKDVENDLSKIDNNKINIDSSITAIKLINKNSSNNSLDISKISLEINEIKSNLSNINFNSNIRYSIEEFFIYNIEIENNYKLNKDNPRFSVFIMI